MTIEQRPSGSWRIKVVHGKTADGKRATTYRTLPKTATRAEAELVEAELQIEVGTSGGDAFTPLGNAVVHYISTLEHTRAPKTNHEYRGLVRRWIHTHPIGAMPLRRIRTSDLDHHYRTMLKSVGPTTVRRTHSLITSTFKWANRQDWLTNHNPASNVSSIPKQRSKVVAASPENWRAALENADAIRPGLRALILVLGNTGMRKSEAIALQWRHVDIHADRVVIRVETALSDVGGVFVKGTKTHAERTNVAGAEVADALRSMRDGQRHACHEQGLEFSNVGFVWSRGGYGLVPWRPDTTTKWLAKAGVKAGQMRHMVATQLLAAGVPPNDVAQVLGHASTKMLFDTYAEATDSAAMRAADVMSRLK